MQTGCGNYERGGARYFRSWHVHVARAWATTPAKAMPMSRCKLSFRGPAFGDQGGGEGGGSDIIAHCRSFPCPDTHNNQPKNRATGGPPLTHKHSKLNCPACLTSASMTRDVMGDRGGTHKA